MVPGMQSVLNKFHIMSRFSESQATGIKVLCFWSPSLGREGS